jgi:chromatin structure-remodeling complex subunit RSC3/30
MSTRRRNGQLSSCEPCRKMKLRCDHALPVCGRCTQKDQSDKCIYHPAPLTHPQPVGHVGSDSLPSKKRKYQSSFLTKKGSTSFLEQYRIPTTAASPTGSEARQNSSVEEDKAKRPKRLASSSTGFLGPSSYWSAFEEPEESSRFLTPKSAPSSEQMDTHVDPEEDMESTIVDLEQIEYGARILTLLDDLPLFQNLLDFRNHHSRPWIFGEMVTKGVLGTLLASRDKWMPHGIKTKNRKSRLRAWSKHIFDNSASTLSSHRDITVSEYFAAATTRWDTIGLIFSWVGITTMLIPDGHECLRLENGAAVDKHELRMLALEVSENCLGFCDKLGTMSDFVSWLLLQHTVLLLETFGDSGTYALPLIISRASAVDGVLIVSS